jgi:signal-transduction protein with cAMP-binding, CBS, and nucleotidyltransferase domain
MPFTNPFIQAMLRISPLSAEAATALDKAIAMKLCAKNTHLLQIGQIDRHFYFINKGCGRVYYLKDGHDVTDFIAMDQQFIGGVESLFTRKPSQKAIEVLEDAEVYLLVYEQFEKLCYEYHDIERLGRRMAVFAFLQCQKRIEAMRFLSAAERYRELEEKYPGITNRVPLKHIASYLGTTQVSISRIRSGLQ